MQNNHWTKWRKRNEYRKEKSKVRLFFSLLWSDQHSRENQSSTVNISENSLCYPFMQPTTFTDNNVCFMFSGKRKQQSKPSTTTTSTFSSLAIFLTRWQPIKFSHWRPAEKNNHKPSLSWGTQTSFPVKRRYTAWRKQVTNVYTEDKSYPETREYQISTTGKVHGVLCATSPVEASRASETPTVEAESLTANTHAHTHTRTTH